ncbi:MAG: VCBS repeat-containing protein [Saprospiraceae bacterium]|nr:VCBS repeat-containing protein [Saprospiraceae bacterium]
MTEYIYRNLRNLFLCLFIEFLLSPANLILAQSESAWKIHVIDNTSFGADGTKLYDADQDGDLDIICGWEQGNIARLYFNASFPQRWSFVEVNAAAVEDAIIADLDQNGMPDIITFSEGDHRRITIHWAPAREHYFDSGKWISEDIPVTIDITQWMFGESMDVDGKYGPDLIVGGKNKGAMLGWLEAPENPRAIKDWNLHKIAPVGWVMSIEIVDINQDRQPDILISDRYGEDNGVKWFENPGKESVRMNKKWQEHLIAMRGRQPMFLDVRRTANDELFEIWVPDAEAGIYHLTQMDMSGIKWKEEIISFPEFAGLRGKSICTGDLNQDGVNELITTYEMAENRSGVVCSYFNSNSRSWQHQDISGLKGVKYDFARLMDMDNDGDLDILTSEENNNNNKVPGLGVIWYENPWIGRGRN